MRILDKSNIVSFTYMSHSLSQACAGALAHWHSATISRTSAGEIPIPHINTLHLSC